MKTTRKTSERSTVSLTCVPLRSEASEKPKPYDRNAIYNSYCSTLPVNRLCIQLSFRPVPFSEASEKIAPCDCTSFYNTVSKVTNTYETLVPLCIQFSIWPVGCCEASEKFTPYDCTFIYNTVRRLTNTFGIWCVQRCV